MKEDIRGVSELVEATERRFTAPITTARELLGESISSAGPLCDAPILLTYKSSLDDSGNVSAAIKFPLRTTSFQTFLNEIAPVKNMQKEDILDDWNMPKGKGWYFEGLQSSHRNLPGWGDFLAHLEQLQNILHAADAEEACKAASTRIRGRHSLDNLIREYRPQIFEAILEDPKDPLHKNVRKAISDEIKGNRLYWNTLGQVLTSMWGSSLNYLGFETSDAYQQAEILRSDKVLGSVSRDELLDRIAYKFNQNQSPGRGFVIVNVDNNKIAVHEHEVATSKGKIKVTHIGDRKLKIEMQQVSYEADIELDTEEFDGYSLIIDESTVQQAEPVYPIARWKTNPKTGNREFDLTPIEDPQYNSYLGLLAALYLDLETRKRLPKELSLPKEKRPQRMGAAQVPLLAYMFRNQLLSSNFVEKAEEYVRLNGVEN